jgi:hypothetical protein
MRRNDLTQLGAGGPVPLPGAFHGAAEYMAGDDGQDVGVPAHRGVEAVLGNQVEEIAALASQSSLPGGLTASGQPGGTYPCVSRSTMGQLYETVF